MARKSWKNSFLMCIWVFDFIVNLSLERIAEYSQSGSVIDDWQQ